MSCSEFAPDINIPLPDVILDMPEIPAERPQTWRQQYQRALLAWLRQQQPEQARAQMRQVLDSFLHCTPPDQRRAVWWVASAYLDCVQPGTDHTVLHQIDQQIRAWIAHQSSDSAIMTSMLHTIAMSDNHSSLVALVKQHYALANYLPDNINLELLPIFLDEADEILPKIRLDINHWYAQPHNQQLAQRTFRQLHTLKGSARMTGAMQVGLQVHHMEDLVTQGYRDDQSFWNELNQRLKQLQNSVDQLRPVQPQAVPSSKQSRDHKKRLLTTRLVAFSTIQKRLQLVVQSVSKELNKPVNFTIVGSDVQIERNTLKRLTAPLEHLLRNSLAHGIEAAAVRQAVNKPVAGNITLQVSRVADELHLKLSDDGAGINLDVLREKVMVKGLLKPDETISEQQLLDYIYISGISTATKITELAGRGIGMDVVRTEVEALGGRIQLQSVAGEGVVFWVKIKME